MVALIRPAERANAGGEYAHSLTFRSHQVRVTLLALIEIPCWPATPVRLPGERRSRSRAGLIVNGSDGMGVRGST